MSDESVCDIVIVGGGPGGLTAGLYCRRGALETVLFEKAVPGGQVAISKDVENYPAIENITGFELVERLLRQAQSYGLKVVQKEVAAIEPGQNFHTIRLTDGEVLHTYAVILATGGSARTLGVPGETQYIGKGVSYCATCDGFFFRDKTVAVVGGGDTAIEEALYLSKLVKKVYLIHRRDSLRAGRLLQERLGADPKIEVIWNTVVKEIQGDGREVQSLALQDLVTGRRWDLTTDGIFIFIGYSPCNQMVPPGIPMNETGYVLTDEQCGTNIPGIYAIGDLRQKYAQQIVIAAADGCTAALAATAYVEAKKFEIAKSL